MGNNIKITVTSEIELKEIRYKWNSEKEKKENMITYGDRKKFEKQLEIPIGQNSLSIIVTDINLLLVDEITEPIEVEVKTRYSSKVAKAQIMQYGNEIKVIFEEPQRAVTPGQSVVFYIDDVVLGGGKIL